MHSLLLLHGALGSKDQLLPLADLLSNSFTVHTPDLEGHGTNCCINTIFSIGSFGDDVARYLKQNNISKTSIFGYSMGGYVAMWLAKNHPALVDKVITLATKFHWDETTAAKEMKMLHAETLEAKVPAFAEQLSKRHGAAHWKNMLQQTSDMLYRLGNNNTLKLPDYSTIHIPCLLLLGDRDKMVSVEETIAVQRSLPQAQYRLLTNTAHPIEQVDAGKLAGIIRDFIE